MKKIATAAALLLLSLVSHTQMPATALEKLKDSFPQERIYIHFDRDLYTAGETIWFKAYLLSGFLPSDLSANFMVELVDVKAKLILQKRLPVIGGTVTGSLELPPGVAEGSYTIRAFTPWMLNFDAAFVYRKPIYIYNPKSTSNPSANQATQEYRFDFFPEGGNLVAGAVNVIAFKATDSYGLPVSITGKIKDASGSEVAQFSSIHDGMGYFGMLPAPGQSYSATINFPDNISKELPLPAIREKGIALQVREEDVYKRRIIISTGSASGIDNPALIVIGHMQQQLMFQQPVTLNGNSAFFTIDTRGFLSGILQLTVFDAKWMPLAERICFVNNEEYRMPFGVNTDTLSLRPKGKNVFSFSFPDTVAGSFSAVITDEAYSKKDSSGADLISSLLLTSDIRGYVHQPSYYFSSNTKEFRTALDLVMLTNGWRRVSWQELSQHKFPQIRYRDKNYIQLSGTIYSSRTKLPLNGGEVNFLLRTRDSLTDFFQAIVDKDGRFFLDNLVYMDSAEFSFQYNSKKNKEKELFIKLDDRGKGDSFTYQFPTSMPPPPHVVSPALLTSAKLAHEAGSDSAGNYITLQEVTVTARVKTPVEILNAQYTSGLFTSMNMVRVIDLVNNEPGAGAQNVFQYIQGRLPGIMVQSAGMPPIYSVFTRRAMSLTGGIIPVPLYLDEYFADASQIATIPMNQVAMIKYFQTGFMGNPSTGTTQALVVYTKKGKDAPASNKSYLNGFTYPGYSIVREFYVPDYEANPKLRNATDSRATLYWNPNLQADPVTGKHTIRFFSNDNARQFRLVIEGFTTEGKLVHEEKILH